MNMPVDGYPASVRLPFEASGAQKSTASGRQASLDATIDMMVKLALDTVLNSAAGSSAPMPFDEFIAALLKIAEGSQRAAPGALENVNHQGSSPTKPADPETEARRKETIAVLGRYEDKFQQGVTSGGFEDMKNAADTPPDLKKAIQDLQDDPEMYAALDSGKKGNADGQGCDDMISTDDIRVLQQNSANKAYGDAKAGEFVENYVPTDAPEGAVPRPMNANDAMRELSLYSDFVSWDPSMEEMQRIADGSAHIGKAPPQLQAAAKYLSDPAAWTAATGKQPNESLRRGDMLDKFAGAIQLTEQEHNILKVMDENRDVFTNNGHATPDKLKKIAEDEKNKPEVRETAQALLDPKGSLLFSMLDNANKGSNGNLFYAANDRKISNKDLDAALARFNKTAAPPETVAPPVGSPQAVKAGLPPKPTDPVAAKAAEDMAIGQAYNQPGAKAKSGGFMQDFGDGFLLVLSKALEWGSVAVAFAGNAIPILKPISVAMATGGAGLAEVRKEIRGEDTSKAVQNIGMAAGFATAGALIPGGGAALAKESAERGALEAGTLLAAEGAEAGAKEATEAAVKETGKMATKEGTEAAGKEGGETAAKETTEAAAGEATKVGATEGGKAAATPPPTWGQQEIADGIRNDVVASGAAKEVGKAMGKDGAMYAAEETGVKDQATTAAQDTYDRQSGDKPAAA